MTRTAAEVADGLLVMPFHSHRHFRERTLPAVAEGLERSGRTRSRSTRRRSARWATPPRPGRGGHRSPGPLAFYGSTPAYLPVLEVEGWSALQPELNALSKTGDIAAMIDLVDDDMLATLAVTGTPEECAEEIRRRFGDVAERICVYFPGSDPPAAQIGRLAPGLRP